ncbi:MAG: AAA family ATPase, partial [Chloroflexota bacterium]|nr:AAA family ATPase [Chloroflexota bacterium]
MRDEDPGGEVQLAKVRPPVLRDETLERPRLLDWLQSKIHGRVVLVIADAGYGKTTLLADFSRRSRTRTLWYRLDESDREWTTFLRHLVAAGREHMPAFAPRTEAILDQSGDQDPSRGDALDTFIEELAEIAEGGAAIILDDFHHVDDAADARHIAQQLLARAPERLTLVIASRRLPNIPLAKLRVAGEVNELATDDLRFDIPETTRLFNDTYGRRLEPELLQVLSDRTEGWIASLDLVQAALRDRPPSEIRRFVRELTGADHELYDYLAEEVVGDLSDEMQRFLMETSLLDLVTPALAVAATNLDKASVARLTIAADRLTLLSSPTPGLHTDRRYHPLVRGFLRARLRSSDGPGRVADLHRRIAEAAAEFDWQVAAHHFHEAGDISAMLRTVGDAMPSIMGKGQYTLAEAYIGSAGSINRPARFNLILSRVDMQQGDYEAAIGASEAVLGADESDQVDRDHALLNLVTLNLNYGDGGRAIKYAEILASSEDSNLAEIARASIAMVTGSETDNIDRINRLLVSLARSQQRERPHHYAVSQYNLASNYLVQDRPEQALREIEPALEILESGSATIELAAARVLRAKALAMLGRIGEAQAAVNLVGASDGAYQEVEVAVAMIDIQDSYAGPGIAEHLFRGLTAGNATTSSGRRLSALCRARVLLRRGRYREAAGAIADYPGGRPATVGIETELYLTKAYLAVAEMHPDAPALLADALARANRQGAHRWRRCAEVLGSLTGSDSELSHRLAQTARESPQTVTYVAELVARRLDGLDAPATEAVQFAASLYAEKWRHALR